MNERKRIGLWLLLLLIPLFVLLPAAVGANTRDTIIVNNADTLRQITTISDSSLTSLLGQVAARVRLEYADTLRELTLAAPNSSLATALGLVRNRIIMAFADTNRQFSLVAPPEPFRQMLIAVQARLLIAFADTNRVAVLSYPKSLVNDQSAPIISNVAVSGSGLVTWRTNEFATSTVRYGTASGSYGQMVSDASFVTEHELQLRNLMPQTKYYLIVTSTDLSGNSSTSREVELTGTTSVFLPAILKQR